MDKPFNYVDPFSQEAVVDKLEDFFNTKETLPTIDMSIDEDLLNDNLTDDSFLLEDKFNDLSF